MEPQVDKKHYSFSRYCYPERWASYYYQLQETFNLQPKTVLEIGAGDYVYRNYIVQTTGWKYSSLDIATDLKPDIVGSIDDMPLNNEQYDLVVAFEVLEHIPFEKVEKALEEMCRVSRKNVMISVPHFGPPLLFQFKVPFLPKIQFSYKIPFPKKHAFNGQHYWELGKKDFPVKRFRTLINKKFKIHKEFIPYENQYHHFFVLEKIV